MLFLPEEPVGGADLDSPVMRSPASHNESARWLQIAVSRDGVYDVLGSKGYYLRDRPLRVGELPAISDEEHTGTRQRAARERHRV